MKTSHLKQTPRSRRQAITRLEVCVLVLVVALLMALGLPMLAGTRQASDKVQCQNNLRRIISGYHSWASSSGGQFPAFTYNYDGGLRGASGTIRAGFAWYEYVSVTNELVTPKILVCPADAKVMMARDWDEFVSTNHRNRSVSYAIGVHGSPEPTSMAFSDPNINFNLTASGCFLGINNLASLDLESPVARWTNDVHGMEGHFAFGDGSVRPLDTEGLRQALRVSGAFSKLGTDHFLRAR